ncbi:MAG TPA: hypothetical protein VGN09_18750 [Vicinamibacteria bacterium]
MATRAVEPQRGWMRAGIPVALIGAGFLVHLLYIRAYAVNTPFQDQWAFVDTLRAVEAGHAARALFAQHNEHRILFPRLFFLALAPLRGWNLVLEAYADLAVVAVWLLGLWRLYRGTCTTGPGGFLPVAALVLSLGQWQNILSGWQVATYLVVAGCAWSLHLLAMPTASRTAVAVLAALVSTFSLNNGLLIWPVGVALLLARRSGARTVMAWAAAGALAALAYYQGYERPGEIPGPGLAMRQPVQTFGFVIADVGSPLGEGRVRSSLVFGALLVVAAAAYAWQRGAARRRLTAGEAACLGVALFSLLSSCAIAVGRVGLGLTAAVGSKYTTIASLGIAALYILVLASYERRRDRPPALITYVGLVTVMATGLTLTNLWGLEEGPRLRAQRARAKYILQTFDRQPDEALLTMYHDAGAVRDFASFLRRRRLAAFRDPADLLLLVRWREGVPLGEILPDRPVVQSLTCPVATLRDLAVQVITYGRRNTSTVHLALFVDGRPWAEAVVPATGLADAGWGWLDLQQPVAGCLGRPLELRISSADATPGNAISLWTYPPYYERRLSQPAAVGQDRVVGLQINARWYGLAD